MTCFLDKTFCLSSRSGQCENTGCHRFFSDQHKADAEVWWGGSGASVKWDDYWDGCPERMESEK